MGQHNRKRTAAEKAARRRRKRETMIIFINGKQKRVKREPTIEGMSVDEFIRRNADPIWLHQNEMWEYMQPEPGDRGQREFGGSVGSCDSESQSTVCVPGIMSSNDISDRKAMCARSESDRAES